MCMQEASSSGRYRERDVAECNRFAFVSEVLAAFYLSFDPNYLLRCRGNTGGLGFPPPNSDDQINLMWHAFKLWSTSITVLMWNCFR